MTAPVAMGGFSPWSLDMELSHEELCKISPYHREQEARQESINTGEPQVVEVFDSVQVYDNGMFMA